MRLQLASSSSTQAAHAYRPQLWSGCPGFGFAPSPGLWDLKGVQQPSVLGNKSAQAWWLKAAHVSTARSSSTWVARTMCHTVGGLGTTDVHCSQCWTLGGLRPGCQRPWVLLRALFQGQIAMSYFGEIFILDGSIAY